MAMTFVLSLLLDPLIYRPPLPFANCAPILNVPLSLIGALWHLLSHRKNALPCTPLFVGMAITHYLSWAGYESDSRIPVFKQAYHTIPFSIFFSPPSSTVMKWKCSTITCSGAQCFAMSRQCECTVKVIYYL